MVGTLVFLLLLAAPPPATAELDGLLATLRAAPAWQAHFVQRYVPSGFKEGNRDEGEVVLVAPSSLRFDYSGKDPRAFAVDGTVARLVDDVAGTCDAVRLDSATWDRLPLAALLDPGAARAAFVVSREGNALRLVPRSPGPELSQLVIGAGTDHLPAEVVATDGNGNRNEFSFTGWRKVEPPAPAFFRPALPGAKPCLPEVAPR
jgi:Outer membrane lipoprotein carrier protein LolA